MSQEHRPQAGPPAENGGTKAGIVIWSQTAENGEPMSICEPGRGVTKVGLRKINLASVFYLPGDPESLEILSSAYCVQDGAKSFTSFLAFIPHTPSVKWVLLLPCFSL